jgi:sulfonate transport system ATP-binding protein
MTSLAIDVRSKLYPRTGTVALEDFRLDIDAGEFVALLGPSGAGKSTLLRLLLGIDGEFDGMIHLRDDRTRIGCMFQEPRLMPWLSALENVLLVTGDGHDERRNAMRLLAALGLAGFESAFPRELSGGMQRRASLARAFAVRPSVLLMDEPFVSLDRPAAAGLRDALLDLWLETRPMVLFVTHDLSEALALADRVVFLSSRPGRVVLEQEVNLPRPREMHDPAVQDLHRELLARHPDLLGGLVSEKVREPAS